MTDATDVIRRIHLQGPLMAGLYQPGRQRVPELLPARPTLDRLWSRATAFGVVGTFLHRRETKALDERAASFLSALAPEVTETLWAHEWPGTRRKPGALLLLGRCTPAARSILVEPAQTLLWKQGVFEDLMLFEGDRLSFYVCTHEGFGTLSGAAPLLQGIGAEARPLDDTTELWIRGVRLSSPELAKLGLHGPT